MKMDNYLIHVGKPERSGRYRWGSGKRPFQRLRIGVGRYQNKDGTLTDAGEKRYNKELLKNGKKKRSDRADAQSLNDPNRWVTEDMEQIKRGVDTGLDLVRKIQNVERETRPKPTKERMDLSHMTDQEMRQKINRELIERQYNDLFGTETQPKVSKGREYLKNSLEVAGSVLAIGSSALGIALTVRQLKG